MNLIKRILISIYFLLLFVIIILSTFYLSVKEKGGQKSTASIKQISYQVEGEKEINYYYYVKNPIVEDCSFVTNRRTGVISGKVTIRDIRTEVKGIKIECVRLISLDEGNVGVRFIEPSIAGVINHAPTYSITDDKGEYIIVGLYDGIYELNVKDAFYSAEPKINIGVYGGFVSSDVDFAIVKSVSVSGQIIDKERGVPLSGINISLKLLRGNFLFSSRVYKPITTNLKGEFVFNYLYPSEYAICFDSEEYSYAGSEDGYVVSFLRKQESSVNIHLTKAEGYIIGIVKDESGKPLSGVGVYLEKPKRKTETDIEGKFKIENILFRDRDYELTFRHGNYLPKKYGFKPIKPNDIQEVIIELASGGLITGTVRNEKGESLEEVEIFAVREEKERIKINCRGDVSSPLITGRGNPAPTTKITTSDEFGFYRLRGLEEGYYYLVFVREGYALSEPKLVEIKSIATITLDVILSKEREIKGKIQTMDLKPIGGVDVELENGKYVFCSKTREDGTFIIRNIMGCRGEVSSPSIKGRVTLPLQVVRKIAIAGDIVLQTYVRGLSVEEEGILITLSGIASLGGIVFDSVENKPVEDYDIALIPLTDECGEKTYSKEIRQRRDGSFEFKYITAGRYFIKVTASGYKEVIYGAVEAGEDNFVSDVRINMIPD